MSSDVLRNRKFLVGAIILAAGLGGGVWAVVGLRGDGTPTVPKEVTVQALKAEQDPGKMFRQVHQAMSQPGLTDDQRHQIMENARTVMEARMDQRMDEYFTAPATQKTAILDRHIDEMQVHMKEMQQRRAEFERTRPGERPDRRPDQPGASPGAAGGSPPRAGAAPPPGGPGGPGGAFGREGHGPPSREERKAHSESRDPDQAARRLAYFTKLRERAEKRGIQMPMGPGRR